MERIIVLVTGVAVFMVAYGLFTFAFSFAERRRERVRARLAAYVGRAGGDEPLLARKRGLGEDTRLGRLVSGLSVVSRLEGLIYRAGVSRPPRFYLLLGAGLGGGGLTAAVLVTGNPAAGVLAGLFLAWTPVLWLRLRAGKRMLRFQRQLPDALDLIARALKAGHSFAGGLRMVADEMDDPIGPEFLKTLEEINFGHGVDTALRNLAERVDCPDLKFFVVSVNIQRETGGNLSEIISNIARLVRERFKLFGRVRVLSAEGRLSALILLGLPFVVGLVINALNPVYMGKLFVHPLGRGMLMASATMMGLGAVVIRRMVKIKV